jgi:hypothetical protein
MDETPLDPFDPSAARAARDLPPYGAPEALAAAASLTDALPAVAHLLEQLAARLETVEARLGRREQEQRQQFAVLTAIREMADAATGVLRAHGDRRPPGAHGAVTVLVAQRQALWAALEDIATADPTLDDARALVGVAQTALSALTK